MNKRYYRWIIVLPVFILLLLLVCAHALSTGELSIPFFDVPGILAKGGDSMEYLVLKEIRWPRILLGIAVGGGLSLAGVVLQGIFKNPLVEPYTLGISGGAALGVSITIVFKLNQYIGAFALPFFGFLGALATIFLVYSLSMMHGKIKIQYMLLIGVMISFVTSSLMMFLMATSSAENLRGIVFWTMGSLDEPNKSLVYLAVIVSLLGLIASYLLVQPLNALRLGEDRARNLGINTDLAIKLLFLISSLLAGVCVSVAGVIGFVGLIIPHLVRLVVGGDFRILLLSSYIVGAAFLVLCDTFSRVVIAPNELPVGVITGILGGAIFIVVLARSNKKRNL